MSKTTLIFLAVLAPVALLLAWLVVSFIKLDLQVLNWSEGDRAGALGMAVFAWCAAATFLGFLEKS